MTAVLASRPLAVGVTHPHSVLGVFLLLLALLAGVGAVALVASRRPAPLAAGLSALTVVLGVAGVVALASTRDCPASGCGSQVLAAPSPTGSPTPEVTETPTPVATTASPTASPTPSPSPTATPTPSRTPSPTPSPTPKRTASPTPSPTPRPTRTATPTPPAFTARTTQQPACGYTGNAGKVTQPAVITVTNTTSAPVTWTAAAQETVASGKPWATLSKSGGTVAAGGSDTVTVTPDASLCTPGDPPTKDHVLVSHDGTTIAVEVDVEPIG